jgi:hypothetical protein
MNVRWSRYESLGLAVRSIRMYLPFRLRNLFDKQLYSTTLTRSKLESMVALGKSIGLDRREVYAAVPSNMDPAGLLVRKRMTLFSALITILIIVVASFLFLVITGNYPINNTAPTYTPGSRYGSISPKDFTNRP